MNVCRYSSVEHSTANSMFYTRDLLGCGYVGVVISSVNQLWLIRCTKEVKSLQLVSMETISGVQAVSMLSLCMMLVLDNAGALLVYSGPVKVGYKQVSCSLLVIVVYGYRWAV